MSYVFFIQNRHTCQDSFFPLVVFIVCGNLNTEKEIIFNYFISSYIFTFPKTQITDILK